MNIRKKRWRNGGGKNTQAKGKRHTRDIYIGSRAFFSLVLVYGRARVCVSICFARRSFDSLDWCHCINIDKLCASLILTILSSAHISSDAAPANKRYHNERLINDKM